MPCLGGGGGGGGGAATLPKAKASYSPSGAVMVVSANRLQFFLASFLLLGFFFFLLIPPDDSQVTNLLTRTSSLQVPSYAVADSDSDSDSDSKEPGSSSAAVPPVFIEDLITLPDNELLLLARLPWPEYRLPRKQYLSCVFPFDSSLNRSSEVATLQRSSVGSVEYLDGGRAAVCCDNVSSTESSDTVAIAVLEEEAQEQETKPWLIISVLERRKKKWWDYLVMDLWPTEEDVVLLAKGINVRQRKSVEASTLRCVFNNGEVETEVTISSQEIFRCNHPPRDARLALYGKPVSLRFLDQARVRASSEDEDASILPSVAYYRPYLAPDMAIERKVELCACTMVHNSVKFLHEWLRYHSHLGVERFFLYDNNSEDGLDSAIINGTLGQFNVTHHPWPWTKTQEAGFSHCALRTRNLCTWTMFIDVDEFLFSPNWLKLHSNQLPHPATPPLKQLLLNLTQTALNSSSQIVGQISFNCRDFGPSGQTRHPEQGVTQGYTCRIKAEERHKSMVRTDAVPKSLANRIHHFELSDPIYGSIRVDSDTAVINHYKFQAWSEFKNKFQRRVSAYVADWKQAKNLASKDRTPGLGFEEIKPENWEKMFCEVRDTALRDYYASLR